MILHSSLNSRLDPTPLPSSTVHFSKMAKPKLDGPTRFCLYHQMLFVLVDTNEARNGRIFEYFRIRDIDVPAVRILNLTSEARYKMPADEVTVENLKEFCQSYLNGKAKVCPLLMRQLSTIPAKTQQKPGRAPPF